ncbi:methyltransferase domain-containing protein [Geodermatophilus sp. SYSU D00684]
MRSTALYRRARRVYTRARFGDLRRTEPLSEWGSPRGRPVDRWYIERFLDGHAGRVHGHALEVKDDAYARRYGASVVDVVDVDPGNERATLVGDLCLPGTLPPAAFDVAVVTQTLQYVADPPAAVRHLLASLRPGGCLLVTVPTLSRLTDGSDRWRWTPPGLEDLLRPAAPPGADVRVEGLGNGLAARAFLFGLAAEDLDDDVLGRTDPCYPLIAGGAVCLPS